MSACNKYTSMQDLVLGLVKFSTKEVRITLVLHDVVCLKYTLAAALKSRY